MSIEAMKQAVVALDDALGYGSQRLDDKLTNAITSLRQAIEQAEKHEWVGLTRDQVEELFWPWSNNTEYKIPLFEFRQVYSIIEAKLKEKNT